MSWGFVTAQECGAPIPRKRWFAIARKGEHPVMVRPAKARPAQWPSPMACAPNWNEQPHTWLARARRIYQDRKVRNGMPITMAIRLGEGWRDTYRAILKGEQEIDPSLWTDERWMNPDWADWLMGFPPGWTNPEGDSLLPVALHQWEPTNLPKVMEDRAPMLKKRIRMQGNCVVPQAVAKFITLHNMGV